MLLDLYSFIVNNPLLFFLLIAFPSGLVGAVFVTRYYYRKGIKEKIPRYALKTSNLVADLSSKIPNLNISYGTSPIRNLTVAKIAFWNEGNATITKEDMAIPFKVTAKPNIAILSAGFIGDRTKENDFGLPVQSGIKGTVQLDFKYLDQNDGALFKVIYEGKSQDDLTIEGKVIGAALPRRWVQRTELSNTAFGIWMALMILSFLAVALYSTTLFSKTGVGVILIFVFFAVFVGVTGLGRKLAEAYDQRYSEGGKLPKNLSAFKNEDY